MQSALRQLSGVTAKPANALAAVPAGELEEAQSGELCLGAAMKLERRLGNASSETPRVASLPLMLFPFSDPAADRDSPLKSQHIASLSEMEEEEEDEGGMPRQVSLVSQDCLQHVGDSSYLRLLLPSLGVLFKVSSSPWPFVVSVVRALSSQPHSAATVLMWREKSRSVVSSVLTCWTRSCRCLPRLTCSTQQPSPPSWLAEAALILLTQAGVRDGSGIICAQLFLNFPPAAAPMLTGENSLLWPRAEETAATSGACLLLVQDASHHSHAGAAPLEPGEKALNEKCGRRGRLRSEV